jgi:NAD(P)H dehydrogenase (quinone)
MHKLLALAIVLMANVAIGQEKIIVSGASGGLAGETIQALLARGVKPADLILVTRTPEKIEALAKRGATVRKGDFNQPEGLPAAFAGGTRMLLISTSEGDRVTQHTNAINAAKQAGVRHIVYTSFTNAELKNPATLAAEHYHTEQVLKKSGVVYTILRNQFYSDSLVPQGAQAIASGKIITNYGDGQWAPVARKDCGAAAAAVLTTSGHDNKTYDITGPELISQKDFAKLLTEISGKPVSVVSFEDAEFVDGLKKAGRSEGFALWLSTIGTAMRQDYVAVKSNAVKDLTGKQPQSVRELLTANKAKLLTAQK